VNLGQDTFSDLRIESHGNQLDVVLVVRWPLGGFVVMGCVSDITE
jgi:hypothetical protein